MKENLKTLFELTLFMLSSLFRDESRDLSLKVRSIKVSLNSDCIQGNRHQVKREILSIFLKLRSMSKAYFKLDFFPLNDLNRLDAMRIAESLRLGVLDLEDVMANKPRFRREFLDSLQLELACICLCELYPF